MTNYRADAADAQTGRPNVGGNRRAALLFAEAQGMNRRERCRRRGRRLILDRLRNHGQL